ncbi:MAG TPA: hypothetical protein VMP01_16055, partial [Pirellulaceae bacterium]|nr:hypothetical protein [Pirellulaceae bacterium]
IFLSSIFLSYSPVRHSGVSDLPRGRVVSEPTMPETAATSRPDSSRHAISVLIVTAAVLWNLVILARASSQDFQWMNAEMRILMGVVFGQVTLGAAYFGLGRWNIAWRMMVLLAAVVASSFLTAAMLADRPRLYLAAHLSTAIVTAFILYGCRCFGLQLTHSDFPAEQFRRQFTLLDALSLMTAVALVAGAFRWTEWPTGLLRESWDWIFIGSTTGLPSLMFPLLFPKSWLGTLASIAAVALSVGIIVWLDQIQSTWFLIAMSQCLLVCAVSSVLRIAGYRLR